MVMRTGGIALVLLAASTFLTVVSPTTAGPTGGVFDGYTGTFTGDQSWGVIDGLDFDCPPWCRVRVHSLTRDITPASRPLFPLFPGIGIGLVGADGSSGDGSPWGDGGDGGNGAPGLYPYIVLAWPPQILFLGPTVDFAGGDYKIRMDPVVLSARSFDGIVVFSKGGRGGNGGWATGALGLGPAWGGDGGAGGAGWDVNVTSSGRISILGNLGVGIRAESVGGDGGNGGWAASATYTYGGDGG
ncbi:MAG: hypothetical protein FJ290_16125 [Planctomycetes bacterium]|nr:hypothetical protein [Planctomycetota bacterium]